MEHVEGHSGFGAVEGLSGVEVHGVMTAGNVVLGAAPDIVLVAAEGRALADAGQGLGYLGGGGGGYDVHVHGEAA